MRPQRPKRQHISMNLQENCHSLLEDMSTTSKGASRPSESSVENWESQSMDPSRKS